MTDEEVDKQKVLPRWPTWTIVVFAFIGILDSAYLAAHHYTGGSVSCFVGSGCDLVTTSKYSAILGIPLALIGIVFYFALFSLTVLYLDTKREKVLKTAALISTVGFAGSLYFVYLQIFVIGAICTYCMLSAIGSTIIFLNFMYMLKLNCKSGSRNSMG